MFRRCLLLAALAYGSLGQSATTAYPNDHFSISIPKDWVAIPAPELRALSDALRQRAPDADAQEYNYGFRPPQGDKFSTHTRVLIQVKHERWSEEVFAQTSRLPRAKGLIQHGVTASSPELATLDAKIGEMRWDPDRQILWMGTAIPNAAEGSTQVLSGVHLTQEGSIQVHCSAATANYPALQAVFTSIIESVAIDDAWKYRPRNSYWIFLTENRWVVLSVIAAVALTAAAFTGREKSGVEHPPEEAS